MTWTSNYNPNGKSFVIQEDPQQCSAYLLVYDCEIPIDELMNDCAEDAKEIALEEFGVPIGSWKAHSGSN